MKYDYSLVYALGRQIFGHLNEMALRAAVSQRIHDMKHPHRRIVATIPGVLYLSYDGLLEAIGQSQIIPALSRLSRDHRLTVLSFEKEMDLADSGLLSRTQSVLDKDGIRWVRLRYHKRPAALAKALDLACGTAAGLWLCATSDIGIIHARSTPPGAIALALKAVFPSLRFVFEMRGFWADQRIESGAWTQGKVYSAAKRLENRLLSAASVVISETAAAVAVVKRTARGLSPNTPFEVVPTCADLDRFAPPAGAVPSRPFTLGFVGSLGVWYPLAEMGDFFANVRRLEPQSRLLIVTQSEPGDIRRVLEARGIQPEWVEITRAAHREVPALIGRMDAGICILARLPSMIAAAPTKIGEFLACGIPCVTTVGVGDTEAVLEKEGAGVIIKDDSPEAREAAARRLLELARDPDSRRRCRESAVLHFSLDRAVAVYDRVYRSLAIDPHGSNG